MTGTKILFKIHIMRIFVFVLLTFLNLRSFSQSVMTNDITIAFNDSIAKYKIDTVIAYINTLNEIDGLKEGGEVFNEGIHKFSMKTVNGCFHLNIPRKYDRIQRINLLISSDPVLQLASFNLIEPGDSINVNVVDRFKNGKFNFTGRGSAKFNCRKRIDSAINVNDDSISIIRATDHNFYSLRNLQNLFVENTVTPIKILECYHDSVNPFIYSSMEAELLGRQHVKALTELYHLYTISSTSGKRKAAKLFYKLIHMQSHDYADSVVISALSYISFLRQINQYDWIFKNNSTHFTLRDLCLNINRRHNGFIRDNLLFITLLHGTFNYDNVELGEVETALWKDASNWFSSPLLRAYSLKRTFYKNKGSAVYNFSLPSPDGSRVSLKGLKGKIIVADFWFTGCQWCKIYAKRLEKEIYPLYKSNSNVVFVSVCGDSDSLKWIRSIKSGDYTNEENINVYTEGQGFTHAFTRYYDINGGPYSMIIDKNGKLFYFDPPKDDMDKLKKIIDSALKN